VSGSRMVLFGATKSATLFAVGGNIARKHSSAANDARTGLWAARG